MGARKRSRGTKASVETPSVTGRLERLPLFGRENFGFDKFQWFGADLVSRMPGVSRCTNYGRDGDRQHGIDLRATMVDGSEWVIQCRQVLRFGRAEADEVLRETTYAAGRYSLFLSCEASSDLRNWENEHPTWTVFDVRDLSREVRKLPLDQSSRLVRFFFDPTVATAFDGLSGRTPFISPNDYAAPLLEKGRILAYDVPLVGRERELAEIREWASDAQASPVGLLVGRGGTGKTKLLLEATTRCVEQASLWFLDPGSCDATDLKQLPPTACIIVVDDAHRRLDEISQLLSLQRARRTIAPVRLLLASRPEGVDALRSQLAGGDLDVYAVCQFDAMPELTGEEATRLATAASTRGLEPWHAAQIASLAQRSPLITVIAARLCDQGILPHNLLNTPDFRNTVLARFRETLLINAQPGLDHQASGQLLELVAAIVPFDPDITDIVDRIAAHIKSSRRDVVRALHRLESAGVIARRGSRVRIVPDVLSDFILEDVALAGGRSTDYATEVSDAFGDLLLPNILQNFAELDWRSCGAVVELDGIWKKLAENLRGSSSYAVFQTLRRLRSVAPLQPQRALALARAIWPSEATAENAIGSTVTRALARFLEGAALNLGVVGNVCDLLLDLQALDCSPEDRGDDHPLAVLKRIAKFEVGKPFVYNEAFLGWAEEFWRAQPETTPLAAVRAVAPLLARSGISTWAEGSSLRWVPFLITEDRARVVATRAADLIASFAVSSGSLSVTCAAIGALGAAIHHDVIPGATSEPERAANDFLEQRRDLVAKLGEIAKARREPVVMAGIAEALAWHSVHGPDELRVAASQVLAELPLETDEVILIFALSGKDPIGEAVHWTERARYSQRLGALLDGVVSRLQATTAVAAALDLEAGCQALAVAQSAPRPHLLLSRFAAAAPDHAHRIIDQAIANKHVALGRHAGVLLTPAFRAEPQAVVRTVQRALDTETETFALGIAEALQGWVDIAWEDLRHTVDRLLQHRDRAVRRAAAIALVAVRPPGQVEARHRITQLMSSDGDSALHALAALDLKPLQDSEVESLLSELHRVPSLAGAEGDSALYSIAMRSPSGLFSVLLRRVDLAATGQQADHVPLPFAPDENDAFEGLTVDERTTCVERVLTAMRILPVNRTGHHITLFWRVVRKNPDVARSQILKLANEGSQFELVMELLCAAPDSLVLDAPAFTSELLKVGRRARMERGLDRVMSALSYPLLNGLWESTGNGPPERFVRAIARARKLQEKLSETSLEHRFYEHVIKGAEARCTSVADIVRSQEDQGT